MAGNFDGLSPQSLTVVIWEAQAADSSAAAERKMRKDTIVLRDAELGMCGDGERNVVLVQQDLVLVLGSTSPATYRRRIDVVLRSSAIQLRLRFPVHIVSRCVASPGIDDGSHESPNDLRELASVSGSRSSSRRRRSSTPARVNGKVHFASTGHNASRRSSLRV